MEKSKSTAVLLVAGLILNMAFFAFRVYEARTFWILLACLGAISWLYLKGPKIF